MAGTKINDLAASIEEIRAQIAELAARLAQLQPDAANAGAGEATASVAPELPIAAAPEPPVAAAPEPPAITDEEFLAISAALAAYLGVRLRIRQIRLISSRAWAQEGRVSIQASHRL